MNYRLTFVLSILLFAASAQKRYYQTYKWAEKPTVYAPSEQQKKDDIVLVKEASIQDIWYDADGQAMLYETSHRIYHVNNAKGVDKVNKGYMATGGVIEEVSLQARCIKPSGQVVFFNSSNVKNVDNVEGEGAHKLFAIDGVEAGCDVEILYTNKKRFNSYGYHYVQGASHIGTFEAHIITPDNLFFETKSYNGLPDFQTDKSDSTRNHIFVKAEKILPAPDEKYSNGRAGRMAYIYQLNYNTFKNKAKIYTWDIIAKELHESYYVVDKKEEKAVNEFLKGIRSLSGNDDKSKIAAFDAYFKTTYMVNDAFDEIPLAQGVKEKKLSESNAIKLYVAGLKQLGVNFELGATCERDVMKLDPQFPSYIFTREWIIYFPGPGYFVSPLSLYSRPGFPNPDVLGNYGLFVKELVISDLVTASAKTRAITAPDHERSFHNLEVKAQVNLDASQVKLDVKQLLGGYGAYYVQPVYRYLDEEQRTEIQKNYFLTENAYGVKNVQVMNTEEADVFNKAMIVSFENSQEDFLQRTSEKYLLNVGMFIGPQSELYDEKKRMTTAYMNYPHHLSRNIVVNIPEGYKVTNLADLAVKKVCLVKEKEEAVFKSECRIEDKKVVLTIYEDYQALEYSLDSYDQFKAVINAAADFNKKKIIFEKL